MSQKINCDVMACKHINHECNCCTLSEITVTPSSDMPTAHYCKNYCPSSPSK